MLRSDWIPLVYFAATGALALARPLTGGRRAAILAISAAMCLAVPRVARTVDPTTHAVMPLAVILAAYYSSGLFAVTPSPRFERWLLSWDRRLFGNPGQRFAGGPRLMLAFLEVIYVGCFLLVPAGLIALLRAGATPAQMDRYWSLVMASELGSFISLPFVYARPPWALEQRAALPDRAVHRLASRFVERLTIRANTFPSGHAAGSFAVALGVVGVLPAIGSLLLMLALAISISAVIGRFHYTVDVVAGVMLALVLFVVLA
jgi:membrane-associated phospholipid phosphatase